MRMRPRGAARHELDWRNPLYPYPGILVLRRRYFCRIWFFGTPAAERPREIYPLVALSLSRRGYRNRLADVSVLSLMAVETAF